MLVISQSIAPSPRTPPPPTAALAGLRPTNPAITRTMTPVDLLIAFIACLTL